MDPTRLMTRTCTITRVTIPDDPDTDEYGNPVPVTSTMTALCELQQSGADEKTVDSALQQSDWRLYLAPTTLTVNGVESVVETEIEGGDRVTIDDTTFEVDGPPWPARNPRTGIVTHIQARLRVTV